MAKAYHAFPDEVEDKLLGLILALGAEVWVLKDRVALLEKVLEEKGTRVDDSIDAMAQKPEHAQTMVQERDAFMERFLRALTHE